MDPLSVAAFVITGGKLLKSTAKLLDKFIHATQEQDRTIRILQALSEGLSKRLEDLASALKWDVLRAKENADLLTGVDGEMRLCQGTIDDINKTLQPLQRSEEGSNAISAAWRAFRQQVPHSEIDRLVSQMRAHSTNLQLTLQQVNIIIAASIPGAITSDLAPRFERLERMIGALRPYLDAPTELERQKLLATSVALNVNEKTNVLYFSALSLYEGSLGSTVRSCASESHIDTIPMEEEQPAFEDLAPTQELRIGATTSEAGVPLNGIQRSHIGNWIQLAPDATSIEMDNSDTAGSENDSDADQIKHLAFDQAEGAFTRGMRFYHQQKFSEARTYLKLGIELTASLRDEQKAKLELPSRQFHHALSCIVESSLLPEAESSFRLVVERKGPQKADPRLQCLALYQLAKVQLRIGKYHSARKYCERAVTRMKKDPLIGDGYEEYVDALYLLALISWADGEKPLAWVCSDLLPPERQMADDEAFDNGLALMIDNQTQRTLPANGTDTGTRTDVTTTVLPSSPMMRATRSNDDEFATMVAGHREEKRGEAREVEQRSRTTSMATSQFERTISHRPLSQQSNAASVSRELSSPTSTNMSKILASLSMDEYSVACRTIKVKKFQGKDGVTKGLCWAAENDRLDVLEVLMADGNADLDAHKSSGFFGAHDTPLMIAALNGHESICKRLLQANAAVNLVSRKRTALNRAIAANKSHICKLLLEHGATPDWVPGQDASPLFMAAKDSNIVICQLLLNNNADVDETDMHAMTKRQTALMHAASENNTKMLQWLLNYGAHPDGPAIGPIITTPLIEAAWNHSIDACRMLLERNANANLCSSRGKTAARGTADKWLREFIEGWPDTRAWKKPTDRLMVQP